MAEEVKEKKQIIRNLPSTEAARAEHEHMMKTNQSYYETRKSDNDPPWQDPPIVSREDHMASLVEEPKKETKSRKAKKPTDNETSVSASSD